MVQYIMLWLRYIYVGQKLMRQKSHFVHSLSIHVWNVSTATTFILRSLFCVESGLETINLTSPIGARRRRHRYGVPQNITGKNNMYIGWLCAVYFNIFDEHVRECIWFATCNPLILTYVINTLERIIKIKVFSWHSALIQFLSLPLVEPRTSE